MKVETFFKEKPKKRKAESVTKIILQTEKKCYVCGSTENLHKHHIFGGNKCRSMSEKYGLYVYLTGKNHNQSNEGVHFNPKLDAELKEYAQREFEKVYGHDMFLKLFKGIDKWEVEK